MTPSASHFFAVPSSLLPLILDYLLITTWIIWPIGAWSPSSLVPSLSVCGFAWFKPGQTKPKTLNTHNHNMALVHLRVACWPMVTVLSHLTPSQATCFPLTLCPPDTQCSARVVSSHFYAGTCRVLSAQRASLILTQLSLIPLQRFTLSWFQSSTFYSSLWC